MMDDDGDDGDNHDGNGDDDHHEHGCHVDGGREHVDNSTDAGADSGEPVSATMPMMQQIVPRRDGFNSYTMSYDLVTILEQNNFTILQFCNCEAYERCEYLTFP